MSGLWAKMGTPVGSVTTVAVLVVLAVALEGLPPCRGDSPEGPWRLSEHLSQAAVTARLPGRTLALENVGPAFHHPALPAWNWVGVMPAEVEAPSRNDRFPRVEARKPGRAEVSCIWIHPVNDGKLVLEWPEVPLGRPLHGFFHYLRSARKDAQVDVELFVDGKSVATLKPRAAPGGIWEFDAALPGTGTGRVRFVVEQRRRGKNHLCFDGVLDDE
jgi:hypothetical protein